MVKQQMKMYAWDALVWSNTQGWQRCMCIHSKHNWMCMALKCNSKINATWYVHKQQANMV